MSTHPVSRQPNGIRRLCGTVLVMEAVVIGLAIPVAIVLEHARHGLAGGVGGGLALCALLLSGVVGRPGMPWALWAGTALQALIIAAGVVVPAMYVLGAIFAALWLTGIWLARRHDPQRTPLLPRLEPPAGPIASWPAALADAISPPPAPEPDIPPPTGRTPGRDTPGISHRGPRTAAVRLRSRNVTATAAPT
jgi:Protein of unknown function (DUF4233)